MNMTADTRIAQALDRLVESSANDLKNLQVKLTYVGVQRKPVPTVAFTTFFHLLRPEDFRPLRTAGLHYDNDEIALLNFTVSPEDMKTVATGLRTFATSIGPLRDPQSASFALCAVLRESRSGDVAFEILAERNSGAAIFDTLRGAFDRQNGVARAVLDIQRKAVGV